MAFCRAILNRGMQWSIGAAWLRGSVESTYLSVFGSESDAKCVKKGLSAVNV